VERINVGQSPKRPGIIQTQTIVSMALDSLYAHTRNVFADKLATSNDLLCALALAGQFKGLHQAAI